MTRRLLPYEIRSGRLMQGLTQRSVGGIVGVTQPAVSRWETGSRRPREDNGERLQVVLAVPIPVIPYQPRGPYKPRQVFIPEVEALDEPLFMWAPTRPLKTMAIVPPEEPRPPAKKAPRVASPSPPPRKNGPTYATPSPSERKALMKERRAIERQIDAIPERHVPYSQVRPDLYEALVDVDRRLGWARLKRPDRALPPKPTPAEERRRAAEEKRKTKEAEQRARREAAEQRRAHAQAKKDACRAKVRAKPYVPAPECETYDAVCYPTKGQAVRAFVSRNQALTNQAGGVDQEQTGGEFDAVNEKRGLRGKRKVKTLGGAIAAVLPTQRPYCLNELDLETLNETAPALEVGGFVLPDEVLEQDYDEQYRKWLEEQQAAEADEEGAPF